MFIPENVERTLSVDCQRFVGIQNSKFRLLDILKNREARVENRDRIRLKNNDISSLCKRNISLFSLLCSLFYKMSSSVFKIYHSELRLMNIKKTTLLFSLLCIFCISSIVSSLFAAVNSLDNRLLTKPLTESIYVDKEVLSLDLSQHTIADESVFHLFTHGQAGALWIEQEWKTPATIASWLQVTALLEGKTHLNIYGCNFAEGEKGRAAVAYLETVLGVTIAASDDVTGVDGDWDLEVGTASNSLKVSNYSYNLQTCNCTETVYLNEVTGGGAVHKYEVKSNGTVTELAGANGIPWFDSDYYTGQSNMSLPSPHGLGYDLNGNLYVGETWGGDIRRLTCDGALQPESEFVINNGGFNIGTMGNMLFVNDISVVNSPLGDPYYYGTVGYDLCTGQEIGRVCHPEGWNNNDWGFYVSPEGTFYSTGGLSPLWWQRNGLTIYKPTLQDFCGWYMF